MVEISICFLNYKILLGHADFLIVSSLLIIHHHHQSRPFSVSELINNSIYTKSSYSIYLVISSIVFDPALLPVVASPQLENLQVSSHFLNGNLH